VVHGTTFNQLEKEREKRKEEKRKKVEKEKAIRLK
jgi:hypothetical protein